MLSKYRISELENKPETGATGDDNSIRNFPIRRIPYNDDMCTNIHIQLHQILLYCDFKPDIINIHF